MSEGWQRLPPVPDEPLGRLLLLDVKLSKSQEDELRPFVCPKL